MERNCSPWVIDFTDALTCFDACPVCVCVWLIIFFMVISEVDKKHHQFLLSECVSVFVTTFVDMDVGKACSMHARIYEY